MNMQEISNLMILNDTLGFYLSKVILNLKRSFKIFLKNIITCI